MGFPRAGWARRPPPRALLAWVAPLLAIPAPAEEDTLPGLKKELIRAVDCRSPQKLKGILPRVAALNTVPAAELLLQVSFGLRELDLYDSVVSCLAGLKLKPASVLIFNGHDSQKDKLARKTIKAVADFVAAGGYLFTSDWELQNVLSLCFPRMIGMSKYTEAGEVKIRPAPENADHPYLRDVFPKNPFKSSQFKWKIDGASSTLRWGPQAPVYMLVQSDEMEKQYGNPAVAATFRHGKGSVLHVMSHFNAQRDPKGDGFALQQLLANFILEKQKWRAAEMEKKSKKK